MSDPTKFPQMHIAESVFNRIMNMRAELLPVNIPVIPDQKSSGGMQQIPKTEATAEPVSPSQAADTAIQGTDLDSALAPAGDAAMLPGAGGSLGTAAGIDAGMVGAGAVGGAAEGILGAGAAAGAGTAAGAAVAGEAVASGAELLPLLLV
jgi:hypothetical protein